jgi:hypothetical protein
MMFENNSPAKRLLPILHESEKENQILTINSDVTPTDPSAENFYVGYKQLTLTPDANAIIPSITTDAHAVQTLPAEEARYRFIYPFHASSKSRQQEGRTIQSRRTEARRPREESIIFKQKCISRKIEER